MQTSRLGLLTPGHLLLGLICALIAATGPVLVLGPRGTWIMLVTLVAIGAAWQLWRQRRVPRPNRLIGFAVLPLLAYSAVTIVWTPVPEHAWQRIGELCGFFLATALLASMIPNLAASTRRRLGAAMTTAVILGLVTLAG